MGTRQNFGPLYCTLVHIGTGPPPGVAMVAIDYHSNIDTIWMNSGKDGDRRHRICMRCLLLNIASVADTWVLSDH